MAHDLDAVVATISEQANSYLSEHPESTIAVGITIDGRRTITTLRSPEAQCAPVPEPDAIYEIGSVSKVFTTTILAALEHRGLLSIDDPISRHLPPELELAPEIAAITIRDLATHSGGFENTGTVHQQIIASETRGSEPPFGCYTHYLRYKKEHLYADLECAKLQYPTGKGWEYSVLGMGTVGHILELVTGMPYEQLLEEIVTGPLGLRDVAYTLSPEQLERMTFAYDAQGQPCPNWYHDVMLPQGGLRGTVPDLLTFVEANIAASRQPDDSELSIAMRRARQIHFTAPDDFRLPGVDGPMPFGMGLAWMGLPGFADPAGRTWWHAGITLFYNAGIGVDEDSGVGIAVLTSSRTAVIDAAQHSPMSIGWLRLAVELASEART